MKKKKQFWHPSWCKSRVGVPVMGNLGNSSAILSSNFFHTAWNACNSGQHLTVKNHSWKKKPVKYWKDCRDLCSSWFLFRICFFLEPGELFTLSHFQFLLLIQWNYSWLKCVSLMRQLKAHCSDKYIHSNNRTVFCMMLGGTLSLRIICCVWWKTW